MKRHWAPLLCLGLVAGAGRVAQLGGFGEVSPLTHGLLEVLIEGSRIAVLLFVLGFANLGNGLQQIVRLFSGKCAVTQSLRTALTSLRTRWVSLTVSFIAFAVIAASLNILIDQLAYETCLYLTLTRQGILMDTSSEWTILLFFKNISVIPFTLVFETFLLLWLANKWPVQSRVTPNSVT